jgi:hypothetical protein
MFLWLSLLVAAEAAPRHTVQVDPLTTLLGFTHVQFERVLAPSWSLYAGPHLRTHSPPWGEPEPYRGFGLEAGVRWYPAGAAPEGWWLLGRGVLAVARSAEGETSPAGYGSALGGYTAILGERWVLSGGLGVQRLHYTVGPYGIDTWAPAAHTAFGLAF